MEQLINQLRLDYPSLIFVPGKQFYWSPGTKEVFYRKDVETSSIAIWSLLHEAGHALLGHQTYQSDFELLIMESEAWHRAAKLAKKYRITLVEDHIQDCLDTYRDWLHRRSACPRCGNQSLQASPTQYHCFNCGAAWHVSAARFCRPYRRLKELTVATR